MIFLGPADPGPLRNAVIQERMNMCLAEARWPYTKVIAVKPRGLSGLPTGFLGTGPKPPNEVIWRVVRMVTPGACWSCWGDNGDQSQRAMDCADGRCDALGPEYPPGFG